MGQRYVPDRKLRMLREKRIRPAEEGVKVVRVDSRGVEGGTGERRITGRYFR